MEELDSAGVSYQVVLTKADKMKAEELAAVEAPPPMRPQTPAAHPDILATSAEKGDGLDALRGEIAAFSAYAISR